MEYNEIIEKKILASIDELFHNMYIGSSSSPKTRKFIISRREQQKEDLKKLLSLYIDEQFKTIVIRDFVD